MLFLLILLCGVNGDRRNGYLADGDNCSGCNGWDDCKSTCICLARSTANNLAGAKDACSSHPINGLCTTWPERSRRSDVDYKCCIESTCGKINFAHADQSIDPYYQQHHDQPQLYSVEEQPNYFWFILLGLVIIALLCNAVIATYLICVKSKDNDQLNYSKVKVDDDIDDIDDVSSEQI